MGAVGIIFYGILQGTDGESRAREPAAVWGSLACWRVSPSPTLGDNREEAAGPGESLLHPLREMKLPREAEE